MLPHDHAVMLGFTAAFLAGTLLLTLYALVRIHRRIS
jgi:hypothetical protein